jgi:hypothetical protein
MGYDRWRHLTLEQWQNEPWPHVMEFIYQNSTIHEADGYFAGPSVGLQYSFATFYHQHDTKQAYPAFINPNSSGKTALVCCAINPHTDKQRRGAQPLNRQRFIEHLQKNGIINHLVRPETYWTSLVRYRFVISPEGNGLDCHRHYEALVARAIPVMEDNPLIRAKYSNLPILWTKDYSEITPAYLEKQYANMLHQHYDFRSLLYSYWSVEQQAIMNERGHYWGNRFRQPIAAGGSGHPLLSSH